MSTNKITRVEINKLWDKYNIVWDNLHTDVNILVGVNGSGKSTLLKIIYAAISKDEKSIVNYKFESARIVNKNNWHDISTTKTNKKSFEHVGYPDEYITKFQYINTFDMPVNKSKLKADESPLMLELRNLILQTGSNSFNDYRLKATQSVEMSITVNKRIEKLFNIINKLFKNTSKTIQIDNSNKLVFVTQNSVIDIEQLSAGEKQLLLILLNVFLMNEEPYILLMDEPEISMHLNWQQEIIGIIRELNPKCQLIIATHSPSIFAKGWGEKVTFMEKLFIE